MKKAGEKTRNKILNFLIEYISIHGYPPSIKEICEDIGLSSTATIHSHLNKMFELGIIETDVGIGFPRAIRIPGYKFVKIKKGNYKKEESIVWKQIEN